MTGGALAGALPFSAFMAGGGTGGHVYPLLSVADALRELCPAAEPIFIGTERGIERRVVPAAGYRLELMATQPFLGGGARGAARGLVSVARALPRCRRLIAQHRPRVVFSVGGYAAVPMALAARLSGVPLALMEPNAVPGLANRLVGPVARRVYTSFEETAAYFRGARVTATGMALRPGFAPAAYAAPAAGEPLRVLVLGGSQGAASLNEAVLAALGSLQVRVELRHQVGRAHIDSMGARYAERSLEGVEVIDFIDDMPAALAAAQIVISRAGGGAIAEICAVGRPAVLVPLPGSGDHQLHNARAMERAGAALCIPWAQADGARLASALDELAADPERLAAMAACATAWGRPDSARMVARDLLDLAGRSPVAGASGAWSGPGAGAPAREREA